MTNFNYNKNNDSILVVGVRVFFYGSHPMQQGSEKLGKVATGDTCSLGTGLVKGTVLVDHVSRFPWTKYWYKGHDGLTPSRPKVALLTHVAMTSCIKASFQPATKSACALAPVISPLDKIQ
jgi:hypothetical protein